MTTQANQHENENDKLAKLLTVGLISGVIAAGVNVCYMLLYESMTGFSIDKYINALSVSIASIVPGVFSGLLFFSLRRIAPKSSLNSYLVIVIILALLSFLGPLGNELPDGTSMPPEFAGLTIPMHIFAPIIYIVMATRSVKKLNP